MMFLSKKVPPPLITALIAAAIWALPNLPADLLIPQAIRLGLAIVLVVMGAIFDFAALVTFFQAETTVNPLQPENSQKLVTNGIYQISRNPMYVGLAFYILAWGIYLSSPWVIVGLPCFIIYITQFQIKPEEQALQTNFGAEFEDYKHQVRRWL